MYLTNGGQALARWYKCLLYVGLKREFTEAYRDA